MAGRNEVAARWRKSRTSGVNNCVEVCVDADQVRVRDSKDQRGQVLIFSHSEWQAFLTGVQDGEFDLSPAVPSGAAPR